MTAERRRNIIRDTERKGPVLRVKCDNGSVFEVPRVYVNYHGSRYAALAAQVGIYDWPKVDDGAT